MWPRWYGIMQIIRDHLLLSAGRHTESVRIRPAPPPRAIGEGALRGRAGSGTLYICSLPPFAQSLMSVCVDIFAQSARLCTETRTKTHE